MKERGGWRVYVMVGGAILLWGSAFPAIRVVVMDSSYSPGQLTFVRLAIAALTLCVYAFARGVRLPAWRDVPMILLLGLTGIALYHTALNFGERTVTAGSASFIVAASPLFATVFSVILLGDRPGARTWVGMAIAFVGVSLIAMTESGGIKFTKGAMLILLAAVSGGFFVAVQKPLLRRYSATELSAWAMAIGAVLTCFFAPGCLHAVQSAPLSVTLAVVYLGIFPAALAYLIWAYALSHFSVARMVSSLYVIPVVTLVIAIVWPGEWPRPLALVGGALALAGVVQVNRHKKGEHAKCLDI